MSDLYAANTPSGFWRFDPVLGSDAWAAIIQEALSIWPEIADIYVEGGWDNLTEHILGEGRFGANHWQLGRGMRISMTSFAQSFRGKYVLYCIG